MKRWYLLPFVLLLLLPVTIVQANSTETIEMTEEQLLEEAERNGWLEPSRIPETSESLKEQAFIYKLSEQFLNNIQQRNTTFTISGLALDFSIESREQASRIIFQAIISAYNKDEFIAYDARGYDFRYTYTSSQLSATFNHKYGMTKDQAAYVEEETKRLAPIITKNSKSDHDKVKAIHDYVVLNVEYDGQMRQEYNTPFHALTRKETLCSGYSTLTYKLLEAVDVPVRLISGTSNKVGHAWNMVQVDGKWYHLDTTWDDPINTSADSVFYNYYMLSDKVLKKTHFWVDGGLNKYDRPYPKATSNYKRHLEDIHHFNLLNEVLPSAMTVHSLEQAIPYFQQQINHYEDEGIIYVPKDIHRDQLRRLASTVATNNKQVDMKIYFQDPTHRNPDYQRMRLTFDYGSKKPILKKLQFSQPTQNQYLVNDTLSFKIEAIYDNGKTIDVTDHSDLTFMSPNSVATYSNGLVHLVNRGTAELIGRYKDKEVSFPVHAEYEWMLDQNQFGPYEEKKKNVPTTHTWTIVFNDELNRNIQRNPERHILVTNDKGESIASNMVTNYNTLKVHPPIGGYKSKTTYHVYIYDIKNKSNVTISPPVRFTFTTK